MRDLHREDTAEIRGGDTFQEKILAIAESVDRTLQRIDMALMHQAGVGSIQVQPEEDGGVSLGFEFAQDQTPVEMRSAGKSKTLKGTGMSVMEFTPEPYRGVKFICAEDSNHPLGYYCYAEVAQVGGERKRYGMAIMTEDQ